MGYEIVKLNFWMYIDIWYSVCIWVLYVDKYYFIKYVLICIKIKCFLLFINLNIVILLR